MKIIEEIRNWKDWAYWLKGGIIAALVPIIVFIANFLIDSIAGTSGETSLFYFLIIASPAIPIFDVLLNPSIPYNITYIIFFVSTLVIYFIIGSIIGWIVGKRKRSSLS